MADPLPPVFVLGSHRSGTSAATTCLESAGGGRRRARRHPDGTRESPVVQSLGDWVLDAAGGNPFYPPETVEPPWPAGAAEAARAHLAMLGLPGRVARRGQGPAHDPDYPLLA